MMNSPSKAKVAGPPKVPNILYIEDDVPTARLFETILQTDIRGDIKLTTVRDVKSALAAVDREGAFEGTTRPDLIVLDLNLPGVSGFAVLEEIRAVHELDGTPVVVFSSSMSPADRLQSEVLGATEFISKPMDLQDFRTAVDHICSLVAPLQSCA